MLNFTKNSYRFVNAKYTATNVNKTKTLNTKLFKYWVD